MVDDKYPEVFLNGKWSPICGHGFWNNNNGATLFCQKLSPNFRSGKVIKRTDKKLKSDAVRVGICGKNNQWLKCKWGCNDLGLGNGCSAKGRQEVKCAKGESASIEIKCSKISTHNSDVTDCKWGAWGQWKYCSKSCGNGSQERTRNKVAYAKNGGKKCVGNNRETRPCKIRECSGKKK